MKKTVYVVIGATASGKTDYSVRLAKKLGGEVISCDSMQIYKKMSIGTAKPTEEEMDGVPHHLIDFVEPTEDFSVNTYRGLALPLLETIQTPIICGGTGLWMQSLFSGFSEAPAADSALRASYIAMAEEGEDLFLLLQKKDPKAAARLHPNDQKRIIRALEVFDLSGQSILDFEARAKETDSPYAPYYIFMARSRDALYERIDRRVDLMMEKGLLEEAAPILREIPKDATALQGIGYKEFFPYFENTASLESCIEALKQNTRRYAKRQLTWFRRIPVHEIICS